MTLPTDPKDRCTAHNQSGSQCKNPAVPGATVCRFHGGAAPQVKAAAQRRLALADAHLAAETLGLLVDVSPEQALLDEVQRCAGMVAFYQRQVELLAEVNVEKLVPKGPFGQYRSEWVKLFNEERDRLTHTSAAAIRAGIEERRVQLAEQQGQLVAAVIRRILTRLNLTDDQASLVATVVPEELRALTA